MNAWFHSCSVVVERYVVVLQIFSTSWSNLCRCHKASTAENGLGLHSHFFVLFVTLDSYQQLTKFPRCRQPWWWTITKKLKLKLYEVVIGIVFRPLFYGIVQPKALLSFGSSSLLFFPLRGSIGISSCLCMKMAWASFDSFGAMTFLLKNQSQKMQKFWKRATSMDSHTSFITCGTAHCLPLSHRSFTSTWL